MKTTIVQNNRLSAILAHYHTVESLQRECRRSRSWAYRVMQHLPCELILDEDTGRQLRIVRRTYVRQYLRTLRRPGNPNWG